MVGMEGAEGVGMDLILTGVDVLFDEAFETEAPY
jgi:hypothetical protein